jgi:bacillithiol biosynthesis cysteine-adding enzyme BshC
MQQEFLPFRQTGYFSPLICDYLDKKSELKPFYNRFPNLQNFNLQIEEKKGTIKTETRAVLVDTLKHQYKKIDASDVTLQHIKSLELENTFTITTGHQLNLFTGPLYFLYKIISTINLTKQLKEAYPEYNFVPVYWMATEDHDFDEINYFNLKGRKFQWNKDAKGAVGELSTDGLNEVFELLSQVLGSSLNAAKLKNMFQQAYLEHNKLADATRFLANELFKDYGLVIIDANNTHLKRLFIPYIQEELTNKTSFKEVSKTNEKISLISDNYKIQVNPREINLFYLKENLRERIVFKNNKFSVINTTISWSKDEILEEVSNFPERFSPNVIMRPLYQEVILPNLCYIGGGGELAYWFQLKQFFNEVRVPFPILLLRNSVLIISKNQYKKLQKLHITNSDLFLNKDALINKKVREISNIEIDFSPQKQLLKEQFKDLYKLAEQTDKSFLGAVKAQEIKQLKGLDKLEKRLLKAQKKKLSDQVERMVEIKNELFPNGSLQERNANFSEFYLEYGEMLIPKLVESLEPLKGEFITIKI